MDGDFRGRGLMTPSTAQKRIPTPPATDSRPELEASSPRGRTPGVRMIVALLVPILLLVAVIVLFVRTDGAGLNVAPAAPIEPVQFGQTSLRAAESGLPRRH